MKNSVTMNIRVPIEDAKRMDKQIEFGYAINRSDFVRKSIISFLTKNESSSAEEPVMNGEQVAELFCLTLAEERIQKDNVRGREDVNDVYLEVGRIVRSAIEQIRGVVPKDQPKNCITEVEREQFNEMKRKKSKMLDE